MSELRTLNSGKSYFMSLKERWHPRSEKEWLPNKKVYAARHIYMERLKNSRKCFFVEKQNARFQVFEGRMVLDPSSAQLGWPDADVFYTEKRPKYGFSKFHRKFGRKQGFRGYMFSHKAKSSEKHFRKYGKCSRVVFLGHSMEVVDIYCISFGYNVVKIICLLWPL
jgi:hypothetical protein